MNWELSPWIISLVVLVVWLVIVVGGEILQAGGTTSLEQMISKISYSLIVAPIFLLAVIAYKGWWREVGLLGGSVDKLPALVVPVLAIIIVWSIAFRRGLSRDTNQLMVGANTLLVGLSEELMFRGILFYGMRSIFDLTWAVVITAVIFGLIHSLNGLITGKWGQAIEQALVNVFAGFWMVALRVYLNSIIPLIIIHWLWDFGLFAATAGKPKSFKAASIVDALPLGLELVLVAYGVWLLFG